MANDSKKEPSMIEKAEKVGGKVKDAFNALTGRTQVRKIGDMLRSKEMPPEHHSNPTEYWGPGTIDSIADGGGPLQCIEASEMTDQFEDGPDEFQMDIQGSWPGEKVKKYPRRQAY